MCCIIALHCMASYGLSSNHHNTPRLTHSTLSWWEDNKSVLLGLEECRSTKTSLSRYVPSCSLIPCYYYHYPFIFIIIISVLLLYKSSLRIRLLISIWSLIKTQFSCFDRSFVDRVEPHKKYGCKDDKQWWWWWWGWGWRSFCQPFSIFFFSIHKFS